MGSSITTCDVIGNKQMSSIKNVWPTLVGYSLVICIVNINTNGVKFIYGKLLKIRDVDANVHQVKCLCVKVQGLLLKKLFV